MQNINKQDLPIDCNPLSYSAFGVTRRRFVWFIIMVYIYNVNIINLLGEEE